MKENKSLLKLDARRTLRPYLKAVLVTALCIPISLLSGPSESAAMAGSIPVFIGIVLYGIACFKGYHRCIFKDPSYFNEAGIVSAEKLVLSKLLLACCWLGVLFFLAALGMKEVLNDVLGQGSMGMLSLLSLFMQALLLISILYLAATASHMAMFRTYKILAGIFVLVAVYALESDVILRLKRLVTGMLGGIEQIMGQGTFRGLLTVMAVEALVTAAVLLVNFLLCCWLLRRKVSPPLESVS